MKKTICIVLCLVFLIGFLMACDASFTKQGFEYCGKVSSDVDCGFLPDVERLWEDYDYIEGDFYFQSICEFLLDPNMREMALLYLKYEDEDYEEVKQIALGSIEIEKSRTYSYNGYRFCEDMSDYYEGSIREFPYNFTLTGYHDEKNIIIFLTISHHPFQHKQGELAQNELANNGNIEPFLEEYFPMYDFSQ